jgi:SAM-dependent methyltransferase
MDEQTIKKLVKINQNFYDKTFHLWNQKSDYAWLGFGLAFEDLDFAEKKTISILDVGCGNARVASYLANLFGHQYVINYTGIDNSEQVLNAAKSILSELKNTNLSYEIIDLDISNLNQLNTLTFEKKYNLITAFGLFHHIPSFNLRKEIIQNLTKKLSKDGYFIFTTWNFLGSQRLKKRLINPNTEYGDSVFKKLELDQTELESGDHILDWIKYVTTYRYSHFFDNTEIESYFTHSNLRLLKQFYSDGKNNQQNQYFITQLL